MSFCKISQSSPMMDSRKQRKSGSEVICCGVRRVSRELYIATHGLLEKRVARAKEMVAEQDTTGSVNGSRDNSVAAPPLSQPQYPAEDAMDVVSRFFPFYPRLTLHRTGNTKMHRQMALHYRSTQRTLIPRPRNTV